MKLSSELLAIAARLKTQDNRITAEPMFCVQEKRREYGYDPTWCDNHIWVLECSEVPEGTPGATKSGYKDNWHTVMVAFTEKGCEDYLRQNGHNHGETRIYVESFNRCAEMVDLRAWLMSMEDDEHKGVINSYKREHDRDAGRTIEDALREERNEARAKLDEIAAKLGCDVDEIMPTLDIMDRVIDDARAITGKVGSNEIGTDDQGAVVEGTS